jgi:Lysyl oxidase
MRPRLLAAVAIVLAAALGLVLAAALGRFEPGAANLLPDLRMARLMDIELESVDGRQRLRFTAVIANVGAGPVEAIGVQRDGAVGPVVQRIQRGGDEAPRDLATEAQMYFAGDGHDHWHLLDMQAYRLVADGDGATAVSEKHGFCLWDNVRGDLAVPGVPETAAFTCPSSRADGEVRMGLSIGWRDVYPATLPNQFIDVTGLRSGRYRLWAEADPVTGDRPHGWFIETDETNNLTWVDLELDFEAGTVRAIGYGPSA